MDGSLIELYAPKGVYKKSAEHGRALSAALRGNQNSLRHGESTQSGRTPENTAWQNMRARCFRQTHPAYAHYSGRGITVCERWNSYENFLADMDRRPSPLHELERIDNDGNYEPGNCRWATRSEQMRNTRRTRLSAEDVAAIRESTQSNSHLARRFSVSANTIKDIRQGVIWR